MSDLTVQQVARMVGVSASTINRWLQKDRKLPLYERRFPNAYRRSGKHSPGSPSFIPEQDVRAHLRQVGKRI